MSPSVLYYPPSIPSDDFGSLRKLFTCRVRPSLFVNLIYTTHRTRFRLNSRDFLKSQRSNPGNGISGSGRQPSAGGQSSSARFTSVQVRSLPTRFHLIYMIPDRHLFIRARQPPEAPLKSSFRGTSCATTHCTPETTSPATSATSWKSSHQDSPQALGVRGLCPHFCLQVRTVD